MRVAYPVRRGNLELLIGLYSFIMILVVCYNAHDNLKRCMYCNACNGTFLEPVLSS
jgi:hypothetical protein